jgi:hypothetical protein
MKQRVRLLTSRSGDKSLQQVISQLNQNIGRAGGITSARPISPLASSQSTTGLFAV